MSCCGDKRRLVAEAPARATVKFEYHGPTSLTVVGAVTRRVYWFSGPGARVHVHPSDVDSLRGVPNLRSISGQSG